MASIKTRKLSNLTDRRLQALKPGQWASDAGTPGLIARRHDRRVTFTYRYSFAGKQHTLPLGEWLPASAVDVPPGDDGIDLDDFTGRSNKQLLTIGLARAMVYKFRERLAAGQDPRADPKADVRNVTLGDMLEMHLREPKTGGKARSLRTIGGYRYHLDRYLADWTARPIIGFTEAECQDRHRDLTDKHGRTTSDRVMDTFRAVYSTAQRRYRGVMPAYNPADGRVVRRHSDQPKGKAIARDKLPQWWKEVQALDNSVRRDIYKVALFTGLRRASVCAIRLEHIDLNAKTLHIPKPKGGEERAFTLPLSAFLVETIRHRIADNENQRIATNVRRAKRGTPELPPSPWLFPAWSASGHVTEPKPSLGDGFTVVFSPHTLRNTYIAAAVAAGVHVYDLKRLVNHALDRRDVTEGYLPHDTGAADVVESLRPAQEAVAAKLLELVAPPPPAPKVERHDNVIKLAR